MVAKLGELPEGVASAMYLRDGWPTVVCKVLMKDGRVGIGIIRQPLPHGAVLNPTRADAAALADAMNNVADSPPDYSEIHEHVTAMAALAKPATQVPGDGSYIEQQLEADEDLQASLGQKAHE